MVRFRIIGLTGSTKWHTVTMSVLPALVTVSLSMLRIVTVMAFPGASYRSHDPKKFGFLPINIISSVIFLSSRDELGNIGCVNGVLVVVKTLRQRLLRPVAFV